MAILFPSGKVFCTPSILESVNPILLAWCFNKHFNGFWGFLTEDDRLENELSLKEGFRLFSAYYVDLFQKIWIITEADRSSTTALFPSEY